MAQALARGGNSVEIFLQVGCFSFGGAYAAIPLIRDVVLSYGWLNDETLTYMIAVSESTPGPIMVNLATYVGSSQAGILGAALATTAVVFPSFVIILLVSAALNRVVKNPYVQAVLRGLKPCIAGIILATGLFMTIKSCLPVGEGSQLDLRGLVLTVILAVVMFVAKTKDKKRISPIGLIILAAVLGMIVYGC